MVYPLLPLELAGGRRTEMRDPLLFYLHLPRALTAFDGNTDGRW